MAMKKPLPLLLLACLTACARVEYVDRPYKVPPPAVYLERREVSGCTVNLIDCYFFLLETVEKLNRDKDEITKFYAE